MEWLFEFIFELVLDGSMEISKSKKVPKYIRYPLIAILFLFVLAVIGLILYAGVLCFSENMLAGIFFILIGLFMVIMGVIKIKNRCGEDTDER